MFPRVHLCVSTCFDWGWNVRGHPPLHCTTLLVSDGNQRAQVLLELAAGLAPSLTDKDTSLLYRAIKPMLHHDASPHVQKRAYKVSRERAAHA